MMLFAAGVLLSGLGVVRAQEPAGALAQAPLNENGSPPVQWGGAVSSPKGNGLRMLATGHSWATPALRTIMPIAAAAGSTGHALLIHTGGGDRGSVRSIWAAEHGLDYPGRNAAPQKSILMPAIATGNWDVMTWGVYRWDQPEDYVLWIDACLKANPATVFYVQDAWPETSDFMRPNGECDLAALHARQAVIDASVAQLLGILNAKYPGKVRLIPVGGGICRLVTLLAEGKLPFIKTVSSQNTTTPGIYQDGGHLDEANSGLGWFEGYIYYATLYKKPPPTIPPTVGSFNVPDAALDEVYRRLAWEVVTSHPLSGVKNAKDAVETQ